MPVLLLVPGTGILANVGLYSLKHKAIAEVPQGGKVGIAQGYPHFIVAAKAFSPSSGLAYSGIEDARFAIQFVVKASRTQDPVVQKFIRIYQNSAAVKADINRAFSNDKRLYALAWVKQ